MIWVNFSKFFGRHPLDDFLEYKMSMGLDIEKNPEVQL